jgi:glucosyl-3-phosphoglycerate synthase
MNSMLKDGLRSAAGNSILSDLAPDVVLVPMLNTGHAAEILQLAGMLLGPTADESPLSIHQLTANDSSLSAHRPTTNMQSAGSWAAPNSGNPQLERPQSAIRIVVMSVVEVPPDEPLTMGLDMARSYRALLDFLPSEVELGGRRARVDRVVKVARDVAGAIHQAAREERADTLLLYWKGYAREPKRHLYGRITDAALKNPPCNVILARLEGWRKSRRVFLPVRGGPAAEHALQVGMTLAECLRLPVTVMHNVPATTDEGRRAKDEGRRTDDDSSLNAHRPTTDDQFPATGDDPEPIRNPQSSQVEALGEEPYIVFNDQMRQMREHVTVPVESILTRHPDPVEALLGETRTDDLLIMGLPSAAARGEQRAASDLGSNDGRRPAEGSVALRVSQVKGPPMLLVSTPASIDLAGYSRKVRAERSGKHWTDMPFEHWFVEHTYHGDEFKDAEEFLKAKQASGLTMSIGVLTSNDDKHIYSVLTGLKRVLMEMHPIADQIVVVDAGSTDTTLERARELGVEVYQASEIVPSQGDLHGRGECWWKSLAVMRGDILVWLDPRAKRFHPSTALSLAGPLLRNSGLQLVKAFGQAETSGSARPANQGKGEDFSAVDMSWGGFIVPQHNSGAVSEKVRVQALKPSDLASLSAGQIAMLPSRTLLQVLSPSLAAVVAPFSRDLAARRDVMMRMPVFAGENLELGLLLSVAAEYGTNAIAQVELQHHQPSLPPPPAVRSAIDILQVMARRLQDPDMRRFAAEIAERLQKEIEGRHGPARSDSAPSMFEVRALGPVERPPMSKVLGG